MSANRCREFMSGDECLFCHRRTSDQDGPTNRHGQTVRTADPEVAGLVALAKLPQFKSLAGEVEFLLGRNNRQRFLKRAAEHGKLDLLSVEWIPRQIRNGGQTGQRSNHPTGTARSSATIVPAAMPPALIRAKGRSPHFPSTVLSATASA